MVSANLALRTRDPAAVQAVQPMAFLLIFLTSAYQTTDHIHSAVLRTVIDATRPSTCCAPMRELMLTGFEWDEIGIALLVIAGLGLLGLPLTIRNYRSVYG